MKLIAFFVICFESIKHILICTCLNIVFSRIIFLEHFIINQITFSYLIFLFLKLNYSNCYFKLKLIMDDSYNNNFFNSKTAKKLRKVLGKENDERK